MVAIDEFGRSPEALFANQNLAEAQPVIVRMASP